MDITEIYSVLKVTKVGGEEYVSLTDLLRLLQEQKDIAFRELVLTPFYIDRRRYELYQYELVMSCTESFTQYMERIAGRPMALIERKVKDNCRRCFIEINGRELNGEVIKYISYLQNNSSLQNEIRGIFGEYHSENMFAAFYF